MSQLDSTTIHIRKENYTERNYVPINEIFYFDGVTLSLTHTQTHV